MEGVHIVVLLQQVFDAAKNNMRYYYLAGYGKYNTNNNMEFSATVIQVRGLASYRTMLIQNFLYKETHLYY